MYTSETNIRIHYALTDQMGVVYHGHYAQFYEIGRTEAIRELGYTYKDIEKMGIILPVVELHTKFLLPARYDDVITVRTTLKEIPTNHKITFHSEIICNEKMINYGHVLLYFMQLDGMKRVEMPEPLMDNLLKYFKT